MMKSYSEITKENDQLRKESQDKELLIQNLMEKINYLQRRVVFLENELAEAAGQTSDDEDFASKIHTIKRRQGFTQHTRQSLDE